MMPPEQKSPVTIEDLLRLKKTERPGAEFWSQFERELRQKQLTALVQKRRWWHDLPVLLSRRLYVPAGAAAIVAFTVMTVRYSASGPVAQIENTAPKIAAADPAVETLPVTEVSLTDRPHARPEEPAVATVRVARHDTAPAASASADVTEGVGLLPLPTARVETETPSARSIAANLAHLEQSEPDLANAVMGSRLTPARVVATNADLAVDGDVDAAKKYRLIARYADHSLSPEPAAPALVRERIARRLGDDITERISRVGLEGSRVSLKF